MFFFGNELKIMRADVEQPGRGVIGQGDGHAPFARRETMIAYGNIAVIRFQLMQVGTGTTSGPDRKQLQFRPDIFGIERSRTLYNPFEFVSAYAVFTTDLP